MKFVKQILFKIFSRQGAKHKESTEPEKIPFLPWRLGVFAGVLFYPIVPSSRNFKYVWLVLSWTIKGEKNGITGTGNLRKV
jgi:hypothetical protein